MPKFNVEVELTVKALFTKRPILEIKAESMEAAEKYVDELLDELEATGSCEELEELNEAFIDPLDLDSDDCDNVEIYMTDILSIEKSE
jgi:hypothetical protein